MESSMKIWVHKAFAPVRKYTPPFVSNVLRSIITAFIAPIWQASRNGHIRSSFRRKAMDRNGAAIPWYTYPAIFQLDHVNFVDRDVLEFGGGQSTIWWAQRAKSVLCFDSDPDWCERIRPILPSNAKMKLVAKEKNAQRNRAYPVDAYTH